GDGVLVVEDNRSNNMTKRKLMGDMRETDEEECCGNSGGMGLWWRDINAQIKGYSNHHIEVEVMDNANNPHWREEGGNMFTWERGNSLTTIIKERLDRFLATLSWCLLLPEATFFNLHIHNSDHGPILLKNDERNGKRMKRRLMRFESLWLTDENCEKVVKDSWQESNNFMMEGRLALVLSNLDGWATETFDDLKRRLKLAEQRLTEL
ncbi:hypothetical protein RDABS01_036780, partial [Bienertia sinuspersici]